MASLARKLAVSLLKHSWWAHHHLSVHAVRNNGTSRIRVPIRDGFGIDTLQRDMSDLVTVIEISARLGYTGSLIDIGANAGQCAVALLESGIDASYHGFEPDIDSASYVQALIRANPKLRGSVRAAALGASEGCAVMHTRNRGWNASTLTTAMTPASMYARTVHVPASTGDAQLAHLPDDGVLLIKIDVEGFEHAVLQGLKHTLRRTGAPVFVEVLAYDHFVDGTYSRSFFGDIAPEEVKRIIEARAANGRAVEQLLREYDYRLFLVENGKLSPIDKIDLAKPMPGAQGERNFYALPSTRAYN